MKETMSTLGVPTLTKKAFVATESAIDKCWWQSLEESMREAAEEEKRIAIERGSYHEGVPAITVILNAGWSKRSHKPLVNSTGELADIAVEGEMFDGRIYAP